MTAFEMEDIISEVAHSLAVEYLRMTDGEKENLRRVGRGEVTYDDLIARYVAEGREMAASTPTDDSRSHDRQPGSSAPYVYEDSNVLINKFDLRDYDELSALERTITGVSIARLEAEPIGGDFDLEHLKAIHKAIFGELYGWAGQARQQGFISKGQTLFCAAEYIEPYAADLFAKLHGENLLQDLAREDFARRMAFYASEINAIHPFREGNGRTQRVFMNQLARQAGWELNLRSSAPDVLREAFIAAMSDESQLAALLTSSISGR